MKILKAFWRGCLCVCDTSREGKGEGGDFICSLACSERPYLDDLTKFPVLQNDHHSGFHTRINSWERQVLQPAMLLFRRGAELGHMITPCKWNQTPSTTVCEYSTCLCLCLPHALCSFLHPSGEARQVRQVSQGGEGGEFIPGFCGGAWQRIGLERRWRLQSRLLGKLLLYSPLRSHDCRISALIPAW